MHKVSNVCKKENHRKARIPSVTSLMHNLHAPVYSLATIQIATSDIKTRKCVSEENK